MDDVKQHEAINVLDEPLISCSESPMTGYYRDGMCNTCDDDVGSHTVCIETSREFLAFSLAQGNDLSTPMLAYGFPGLKAGDRWCLCASRWLEAYKQDCAPRVHITRTHKRALEIIPLDLLLKFAADLN